MASRPGVTGGDPAHGRLAARGDRDHGHGRSGAGAAAVPETALPTQQRPETQPHVSITAVPRECGKSERVAMRGPRLIPHASKTDAREPLRLGSTSTRSRGARPAGIGSAWFHLEATGNTGEPEIPDHPASVRRTCEGHGRGHGDAPFQPGRTPALWLFRLLWNMPSQRRNNTAAMEKVATIRVVAGWYQSKNRALIAYMLSICPTRDHKQARSAK